MSETRQEIHDTVRERYGRIAQSVLSATQTSGCCGGGDCCAGGSSDPISGNLYSESERGSLPDTAVAASLGCGNPTALATLKEGETALDLGSGGGIDVLLTAKRVGATGFVYGLDMTDAMLALAEKNRQEAGATNVRFLKGRIESIPLPDNTVDVVLSNCVVNLSPDKAQVLKEAFRVLKPGGRIAISDMVIEGEIPEGLRSDMERWVGCIAGALEYNEYLALLEAAGFTARSIEATRYHDLLGDDANPCCSDSSQTPSAEKRAQVGGRIMSAFIRAVKPEN